MPLKRAGRRVAVFGGSFDPPHLGHRALVEVVLRHVPLDEVWVLPVGQAVHRNLTAHIQPQQRYHWVQQLFADMPQVQVLDWEVQAQQAVASIESMQRVVAELGCAPYWLLGMDAWKHLPTWVAYPTHQSLCHMLVVARQGEDAVQHAGWRCCEVGEPMPQAGCVSFLRDMPPAISSTRIRTMLAQGEDVSAMLHAASRKEIGAAYVADDAVQRAAE